MNREELAAVRELLTAIHDALEDLPVRDEGNAIHRWSSAYCNAEHVAAGCVSPKKGGCPAMS